MILKEKRGVAHDDGFVSSILIRLQARHSPQRSILMLYKQDISVWVVEDNEDYRQTICDFINTCEGMHCPHVFNTCEDMFDRLDQIFAPEVLLMDIGLPGMSGIEGVHRLKSISPATQVIMLTIHEDNDKIFNAICAGASGYLLKMSSTSQILEAIHEVRAGGAVMTPHIARRVMNMFTQLYAPRKDYQLTVRELEILQFLVDGKTKQQIADVLFLSFHTIDTHLRNIYVKLHVHSRSDAVVKALKERLL